MSITHDTLVEHLQDEHITVTPDHLAAAFAEAVAA